MSVEKVGDYKLTINPGSIQVDVLALADHSACVLVTPRPDDGLTIIYYPHLRTCYINNFDPFKVKLGLFRRYVYGVLKFAVSLFRNVQTIEIGSELFYD